MTTADLAVRNGAAEIMERVLLVGDLAKLTPAERVSYYRQVCDSLGLNPLSQPFAYIVLNGKLTLYALRTCTDQLRATRNVSIAIVARDRLEDVYVVTARATTPDGRADESTGVVSLGGLRGDALANALMKAETKAKRRVTLSICGLGWIDESEADSVPGAERVRVGQDGEIQAPVAQIQAPQRTHEVPAVIEGEAKEAPPESENGEAREVRCSNCKRTYLAAAAVRTPTGAYPPKDWSDKLREAQQTHWLCGECFTPAGDLPF